MVEFALTLPVLLLLLFGIIEFGRLFQAWVTIQNAARTAARYAVTGRYDQNYFYSIDNHFTDGNSAHDGGAGIGVKSITDPRNVNPVPSPGTGFQGLGVPCAPVQTPGQPPVYYNSIFQPGVTPVDYPNFDRLVPPQFTGDLDWVYRSHWDGRPCASQIGNEIQILDEDQWRRNDILRLVSVVEAARVGAAGLALGQGYDIPGAYINTYANNIDASVAASQPGWFHVWMCSTRTALDPAWLNTQSTRTTASGANRPAPLTRYADDDTDRNNRTCTIMEQSAMYTGGPDMNFATFGPPSDQGTVVSNDTSDTATVPAGFANPDRFPTAGVNQYDLGAPGDFVEIVVYFNHPLITPLGLGGAQNYIQLHDGQRGVPYGPQRAVLWERQRRRADQSGHLQWPRPADVHSDDYVHPQSDLHGQRDVHQYGHVHQHGDA